jgi:acetyl-CoA hydrolase
MRKLLPHLFVVVVACAACAPVETNVGSARLAEAEGTVAAPEGQLIEVGKTKVPEKLSGPVATPRSEAGVIVTERGAADLRGCSLRERERRLRAISA